VTDHQPDASPTSDAADTGGVPAPADGTASADQGAGAQQATGEEPTGAEDAADAVGADGADGAASQEHHGELLEPEPPDWDLRAQDDGRSAGQLLEALEAAHDERDDYLDALQRSRAEFDNFRRRSAREAAGARTAGVGDLAQQLLDVLDDLDRTVAVAGDSSDEGLAAGITAVRRKLVDALVAAGVERVDEAGVPFDATRHEAVQQVPAEEPVDEPEVAEVLRPGYLHGERVLRAAMVTVRQ
jgi:molecular chaperone GrpE